MPLSIRLFSILYLASLALSAINVVRTWDAAIADVMRDTGDRQLALVITGTFTMVVFALLLLLWHRIVHRASRVAKWLMVALAIIGAVAAAMPLLVTGVAAEPGYWLDALATMLTVVAAAMLFRKDAVTWFAHERSVDPDTFS